MTREEFPSELGELVESPSGALEGPERLSDLGSGTRCG